MTADRRPMRSNRPYLLRAMHAWIVDNDCTPHLLVDATQAGVNVPPHTVKDGRVVLNIATRAVAQLELGNEEVRFLARFGGVSHAIRVPLSAVLAIYAAETGQGMGLPPDGDDVDMPSEPPGAGHTDEAPRKGGHLRVIK